MASDHEVTERFVVGFITTGIITFLMFFVSSVRGCHESHDDYKIEMEKQSIEKIRMELEMKKARIAEIIADHEASKAGSERSSP